MVVGIPRKPRNNTDGGLYHVYARGNAKEPIFLKPDDRHLYLGLLKQTTARSEWLCLAYCLMNNHVHLMVETPLGNLSHGMQILQSCYAQAFNWRHDRIGHVFQGRYGATRIESDRQLCAVAAYIARNPVEAGLCERPEQWPWGSYRALVNGFGSPWVAKARMLSFFGSDHSAARERYIELASHVSKR